MGRLLPLVIFATLVVVACIPRPEKQIDYLELPEAIVVQAKTNDGQPFVNTDVEDACRVPNFTVYGDGTALFLRDGTLRRTTLGKDDVLDLIEPLVGQGYMDYNYSQRLRDPEALGITTFLYIHTHDAANAVALTEVSIGTPNGDEGKQYRNITTFLDTLDSLAATVSSEEFTSDQLLLGAMAWDAATPGGFVPWNGATDLGLLVPAGSDEVKTLRIEPAATPELTPHFVSQNDRVFLVCTRPLLPYEANFPEFDAPTS